jgi:hypothetical protein
MTVQTGIFFFISLVNFAVCKEYSIEVGKGKRADVYLEVRKRRRHICFE